MHIVMQHMPLVDTPTPQFVGKFLEGLMEKEILTPEQAESISSEQIAQFFHSDIGKSMLSAKMVHREVPFTMGGTSSRGLLRLGWVR